MNISLSRILLVGGLFISALPSLIAQNFNISLLSRLQYNSQLSACWGYVDKTGKEYALVGVKNAGISVVDISAGISVKEVFRSEAVVSTWKEIKTYGNYAYLVSEGGGGLQILDLSGLPENTNIPVYQFNDNGKFATAHTLWIDEDGILYLWGWNNFAGRRGYLAYDLKANPINPPLFLEKITPYMHDGITYGKRMYLSHIYDGNFGVYDISDKRNPILLGTQQTPNNFTHNTWPSVDGNYLFTTDERAGSYVAAYDVRDPQNIQEVDRIRTQPDGQSIAHNVHVYNNFLVTSYYTEGVVVHDATDPENLIEVGKYDCSPFSGNGFNGVWEVYPYFPSGRMIASDIEGGLFVFQPSYRLGCYVHGTVVDQFTGAPIPNAKVEVVNDNSPTFTAGNGSFKTGTGKPGNTTLKVTAPGYQVGYAHAVPVRNGDTTQVRIELRSLSTGIGGLTQDQNLAAPNPFTDRLDFTHQSVTQVRITNSLGQVVFQGEGELSSLSTAEWPTGYYVLQYENAAGQQIQQKLMKVK
ncbi:MAG TPA: choice-of-anchor B family protein [Luteibaculaceae bacterium]|nr:choice-of-anchor B family protein [Luteibaculaceae bacterium]